MSLAGALRDSRTVARNTIFLIASKTLVLGLGFAFNIVLARYLLVEGFGDYAFAISYLAIFAMLVKFGMRALIIREVSVDKSRAGEYFGNHLALTGVLFIVALVPVLLVAVWMDYPLRVRQLVFLLSASLLLDGITSAANAIFSAFERMQYPSAIAVAEKVVFVVWGLVTIVMGHGVLVIAAGLIIAKAVGTITALVVLRARFFEFRFVIDRASCAALLRRSAPFFSISVLSGLYAEIDMTMVFSMQGSAAAGLYSAAFRLGRFPTYVSNAFHQSLYPVLAQRAAVSTDQLLHTLERSVRVLATVAVPLGTTAIVLADRVLMITFGPAFAAAAPALKILVFVTVIQFVNPLFTRILFALEEQSTDARIQAFGVAVTVGLNLILIPRYGIVGAAWGSLLATGSLFLIYCRWLSSRLGRISLIGAFGKPLAAGVPMLVLMVALQDRSIPTLLAGGAATYVIVLAVLGGLSFDAVRSA